MNHQGITIAVAISFPLLIIGLCMVMWNRRLADFLAVLQEAGWGTQGRFWAKKFGMEYLPPQKHIAGIRVAVVFVGLWCIFISSLILYFVWLGAVTSK